MGKEAEKKFESIMEKLFSTPPPKSSISNPYFSSSPSRGKKRGYEESTLALVEPQTSSDLIVRGSSLSPADAPLCRPWDRGDLFRRLSTFKSMTWFAKPQVVSAVNCARRGWINLDTDIIVCEACGARLLFSTPSSWSQHQVEEAASVFSLKLENRHKFLCPWIDNACDERLADFPPTPPPVLVDKFMERSSALLQLLALPVISSAATEYMRCQQLEEFLRQPPVLDYGNKSTHTTRVVPIQSEGEADFANLYYQAQKLISLCGWEPRSLPYVVDCKDRQKQLVKESNILNLSNNVTSRPNTSISFCSTSADEHAEATSDCHALNVLQGDPQSVVLDCKLCRASVGLWTYSTVPRPVEVYRLVGYTAVNGRADFGQDVCNENKSEDMSAIVSSVSNSLLSFIDRPSNLNLTIAGGPPPTKQNFKATISFPIVGQNLRARLSLDCDFRDCMSYDQEPRSESNDKNLLLEERRVTEDSSGEQVSQPEAAGMLNSNTLDQGQCSCTTGDKSCCKNGEKSSAVGAASYFDMSLEGNNRQNVNGVQDPSIECPRESIPVIAQGSDQRTVSAENSRSVDHAYLVTKSFDSSSQAVVSSVSHSTDNVTTENGNNKCNLSAVVTDEGHDQQQEVGADVICGKDVADKIVLGKGATHPSTQNTSGTAMENQKVIKDGLQNLINSEVTVSGIGKELKQLSDKGMEFDPIRQHRHFCPWIKSTNSAAAGWQQTLSALFREKELSTPTNPPLSLNIKVDDPIASVRRLFRSPSSSKRLKPSPTI